MDTELYCPLVVPCSTVSRNFINLNLTSKATPSRKVFELRVIKIYSPQLSVVISYLILQTWTWVAGKKAEGFQGGLGF
jgi:hypothetical protein